MFIGHYTVLVNISHQESVILQTDIFKYSVLQKLLQNALDP